MQTVWIIHYLNKYLVHYGVFASKQAVLDFVADFENAAWCVPVEIPVQPAGATFDNTEPVKDLPRSGQR